MPNGKNPEALATRYPCSDYSDFGPIKGYGNAHYILDELCNFEMQWRQDDSANL